MASSSWILQQPDDMVGVAIVTQDHVEMFFLLPDVVSGGYGLGSMEQA